MIFRPGGTSGKVPSESYAFIKEPMSSSERATEDSARACLSDAFVISENCFEYLDAPIKRVASMETPVPFAANLEKQYLPIERFKEELASLAAY